MNIGGRWVERVKEKRRNLIEKICIVLLLISISAGCLQKDTDLPAVGDVGKEPEKSVPVEDKVDSEPEKTVPIEYYVEEKPLATLPLHPMLRSVKYSEFSTKRWSTEDQYIALQCRKALQENSERLAREIPAKVPEHWTQNELKSKEDFLKEEFYNKNLTRYFFRYGEKVIAPFYDSSFGANTSFRFNASVSSISIETACVYDLDNKNVEEITIMIWPVIIIPFG